MSWHSHQKHQDRSHQSIMRPPYGSCSPSRRPSPHPFIDLALRILLSYLLFLSLQLGTRCFIPTFHAFVHRSSRLISSSYHYLLQLSFSEWFLFLFFFLYSCLIPERRAFDEFPFHCLSVFPCSSCLTFCLSFSSSFLFQYLCIPLFPLSGMMCTFLIVPRPLP